MYLNTYVITREYNNTSINKNETMKRVYVYLFMFMFYVITDFQPLWRVTHKSCRKIATACQLEQDRRRSACALTTSGLDDVMACVLQLRCSDEISSRRIVSRHAVDHAPCSGPEAPPVVDRPKNNFLTWHKIKRDGQTTPITSELARHSGITFSVPKSTRAPT